MNNLHAAAAIAVIVACVANVFAAAALLYYVAEAKAEVVGQGQTLSAEVDDLTRELRTIRVEVLKR